MIFVFLACLGFAVLILLSKDLRSSRLAEVIAGLLVGLAISIVLFSIVPSSAPVRATVGLGGAALFFFLLWPKIEVAIHPPPSTSLLRGIICFINKDHAVGMRPVQGADVRIANSSLKAQNPTSETGDFTIFDVPSDAAELEIVYKGTIYTTQLVRDGKAARYAIVPSEVDSSVSTKLDQPLVVDSNLEISGQYWDRTVGSINDAYVEASGDAVRQRVCAAPQGDYIVDKERPGFRAGLHIGSSGGDNYHSELWDGDCFVLYSAGNNGRGSNSWARGIQVALKRLHPESLCGRAEIHGTQVLYTGINQVQMDAAAALGPCVGPDLPAPAKWHTTVVFKRQDGSVADTKKFDGFEQTHALNGHADIWMNSAALLSIAMKRN